MAHEFDTGLAAAQRTLIQTGVVALLEGLHVDAGGYLKAVIDWGGLIRGYTDEAGIDLLWSELQGRAPAIVVGLGDDIGKNAGVGGFNVSADLEVVLYFYVNSQLGMTTGRTKISPRAAADDTLDPGLWIMLEHAQELVLGQRVGGALVTNVVGEKTRKTPSVKQLTYLRTEELRTDKTVTLWAQRYAVKIDRTIDPKRGVTQMLEELRTVVRASDDELVDVVAADAVRPGDDVVELKNTTIDTP